MSNSGEVIGDGDVLPSKCHKLVYPPKSSDEVKRARRVGLKVQSVGDAATVLRVNLEII